MELPREFYKLSELAEKWNRSVEDLLHMAAARELVLSFYFSGMVSGFSKELPGGMISADPGGVYSFYGSLSAESIKSVLINSNDENMWSNYIHHLSLRDGRTALLAESEIISTHKLLVMSDEVARIEAKFPDIKKNHVGPNLSHQQLEKGALEISLAMILDEDHPWHSEPLAKAVQAWLELYSTREGNRHDNSHRPPHGNTKLINDWFAIHVGKIGNTTLEHYRFIINPSKQGGPTKIPE